MSYKEGLALLNKLSPWNGKGDFSLHSMLALTRVLGNPQDKFHSIHVTGTNGKGSVSVALAGMLGAAGMRVGLTTSPHLISQNERIVIDGLPITDEFLGDIASSVMCAAEKAKVTITYFEGITACAFLAFAESKIDWGVIEVGLGGRLDATNTLLKPRACVISTVDLDHTAILGETISKIAKEKAAIIKEGAHVVVGNLSSEALSEVRLVCKKNKARELRIFGDDFWVKETQEQGNQTDVVGSALSTSAKFTSNHVSNEVSFTFTSSLIGDHQLQNMAVAIETAQLLGFSSRECIQGLSTVHWPGRFEQIYHNELKIILDCAHNGAGVLALCKHLKSINADGLTVLFGVLDRPEWRDMVLSLMPFIGTTSNRILYLKDPPTPRAVKSEEIKDFLSGNGISSEVVTDLEKFLGKLEIGEGSSKPLLVTGSIYLIGEFRSFLKNTIHVSGLDKPLWKRAIK